MRFNFTWLVFASLGLLGLLAALLWKGGIEPQTELAGRTLHLYCAAGIRQAVQPVIDRYREEYGVEVETTYEGSGKLLGLIEAGERGDLYLAADRSYIENGQRDGLLDEAVNLARQRPCIAVRRDSTLGITSLRDLLRDDVQTSLADPEIAAIGKVARRMIDAAAQTADDAVAWQAIYAAATVTRHTVNEVCNDIKSGVVDAGIVWDASAGQYDELVAVNVPEFEAATQSIMAAVLRTTEDPRRALHFLRYLAARDRGLQAFKDHAYEVVPGDEWVETPEIRLFTGGLMHPAIQQSIERFEQREGVRVVQTPNGCGILVAQIRTGEHPDVYFACDTSFMTKVADVFPESQDLSGTEMVIVVRPETQAELNIQSIEDLARQPLKLGLTHYDHSALGELSRQLIQKRGLWKEIEAKVVDWPSTADRLVESVVIGGLDAAIVYRANTTLQADKLAVVTIDDPAAQAVQPIAVARDSRQSVLAKRLISRLRSAESRLQFESRGFRWLGDQTGDGSSTSLVPTGVAAGE